MRHDWRVETKFIKFLRVMFWPVIVIAAVNIENWASKNGYASFLSKIDPDSFLGQLHDTLTDPAITHVTAFIAGGVILAWLGYWFELLDNRHGGPPRWLKESHLDDARRALKKNKKKFAGKLIEDHCIKANQALESFGLHTIVTDAALQFDHVRLAYVVYLTAVHALLGKKSDEAALLVSKAMDEKIKDLIAEPQLPLSIGPKTPL